MRLERATLDGVWLTVVSDIFNGTTFYSDKSRDKLPLHFIMEPIGIWNRCDSCVANLPVENALQRRKGKLIVAHHNDMEYEWSVMCAAALTPKYVSHESLINYGGWSSMEKRRDQEETRVGGEWGE